MATSTTSTSSSSSPPQTAKRKKPRPIPWTHQETLNLIRAYEEKWSSLKRGQLRSSHWEEVAVTVAARCGYSFSDPSAKSSLQCRHKMEKLRKRYRAQKRQIQSSSASSSWPYYELMERLERGQMPIFARPIAAVAPHGTKRVEFPDLEEDEDDDNDDEEDEEESSHAKSRSINYILRRPARVNRFAGDGSGPRASAAAGGDGGGGGGRAADTWAEEEEEKRKEKRRRRVEREIAGEIRRFVERYVGMENVKMEMLRERERCRMEMEKRRWDMIVESQRKMVDAIAKAFACSHY